MRSHDDTNDPVVAATRNWVERAVIGLNLCPFAHGPHRAGRIRFVHTRVTTQAALADVLADELERIAQAPRETIETTLLIHPRVLGDFLDFNEFLDVADSLVEEMDLEGEIQVASFHPRYQFEGTEPDDIGNFTNRSPYPTLHLLREESVDEAVAMHPDTEAIPARNIETLKRLGTEGWNRLDVGQDKTLAADDSGPGDDNGDGTITRSFSATRPRRE